MATTMGPLEFVKELHKRGLKVEDAIFIQVQMQEEEVFERLYRVAQLTPKDVGLLQNILAIKEQLTKGHYDEKILHLMVNFLKIS